MYRLASAASLWSPAWHMRGKQKWKHTKCDTHVCATGGLSQTPVTWQETVHFNSKAVYQPSTKHRRASEIHNSDVSVARKFGTTFGVIYFIVWFLLGNSPVSEFYITTFRNTVCSIFIAG
jgi:hypothetical protein